VADYARALLCAVSRRVDSGQDVLRGGSWSVAWESDFVSLHCALTPDNRGLVGAAELARMKPTADLVNTARGALVDEGALVAALTAGRIAGAVLDAFAAEPLPASSPLRSCPRTLITPHQAFNSVETGEKVSLAAADAILDLMERRRPVHVANPDVLAAAGLRHPLRPG
jgi:D-3-phosphoglycerate dehydrogenase